MLERYSILYTMNKLDTAKRVAIISALVEGCSLRSTQRMTGVSINTVTKLLVDAGDACARYQHETLRNLTCRKIQCDEIWNFCCMKQKNVPPDKQGILGYGDVWTWVAIDADTKVVPSFLVGSRDTMHASHFIADLASRLTHRVQLTTDGHKPYLEAVEGAFGGEIDYAMLVKLYGNETGNTAEARYSPGECTGTRKEIISGSPDPKKISTSFSERQNLTMRMRMRRFTRLTNAFSKKLANLEAAVAIHFLHYNFVRRHQTLRVTPAMAAGVTRKLMSLEDIVALID
jgi:IS1 family transposase